MFIARAIQELWTTLNDRELNIETKPAVRALHGLPPRPEQSTRFNDPHGYGSPDYYYLRKICARLAPGESDIVYDLGCGKGRFLCVAGRWRCRRCVGIEISPALAQIAARNARVMSRRKAMIEIIVGDVTDSFIADGTIYYLFNPFGPETLQLVLQRVRSSILSEPRVVRFVYHNAVYEEVFKAAGWLERVQSFTTLSGQLIAFWQSKQNVV